MGLPRPGRGKKQSTKNKEEAQALASVEGKLRRIDEKFVVIEADDNRVLNAKRSNKTKFLKTGDEVKETDLKPGDRVLLEYTQDEEGFLYAVNVNWEKDGTAAERQAASQPVEISSQASKDADDDRPILRRKDAPPKPEQEAKAPAAAAPAPAPEAEPEVRPQRREPVRAAEAPVAIDSDDPGPPVLHRGSGDRRKPIAPPPVQTAEARLPAGAASAPAAAPARVEQPQQQDPFIEAAREAVAGFAEDLPSYVCQEFMSRFYSDTHIVNWRPLDVVSTEVVYDNGHEIYRNIAINGKPTKKSIEELPGAWSTGDFGTVLVDLFSPSTNADFRFRKEETIAGKSARVYDFTVDRENSHWKVNVASQMILPAYAGTIWIDKQTHRVLRLESQARAVPQEFPLDKVESANDYDYIRLGDKQFLMPVHAETLTCERGTNRCSRNAIDFRNYHKYAGESTVTFGETK